MGARGPQSKAAVASVGNVVSMERPRPPAGMTDEQKAEWSAIVNSHAADRFSREHSPMLAAHCRHVVAQRRIAELISSLEGSDDFNVSEYDRLLKMQERESRCLASLAVRLGFAYSTAYEKRPEKGGKSIKRPWES